ncbi:MAG: hypothetical protein WCF57_00910 [Pyrinomonadaceae bacterium]
MNNLVTFNVRSRQPSAAFYVAALLLLLLSLSSSVAAQSTNAEFPTPIGSSEISGVIVPRDVGDSRLTRYFYAFAGTPGDLVVTVESTNLNGDVDVFVAGSLRPLGKVSMYAGELSTSTSKTIYLRQRESLVLRVEARSPNDAEGSYRIRFGGSFEPLAATTTPETEAPTVTPRTGRDGRRVTSVGGRIDEPPATETATRESTSEPTAPTVTREPGEPTAPTEPATPATTEPARPTPPRTARTRRPARTRRGRPARTPPAPTARESAPTTQPPTPEAGARLIIETRDGMRVERFMSTVRRVTVENGQIVIITKDGVVQRQPLTNVVRMAIEQ